MATTIRFACANCTETFEEPVQAFIDEPGEIVMAPALCRQCGCDPDDKD